MVVFDRDFARVWYDGTTPCVFSSVVKIPEPHELEELLEKQILLIRELRQKYGFVYSICDLRFCKPAPADIRNLYMDHIAIQFDTGLSHKSFVRPENVLSKKHLLEGFTTLTRFSISIHETFEEALDDMNRRRTQRNFRSLRSVFGFLRNLA